MSIDAWVLFCAGIALCVAVGIFLLLGREGGETPRARERRERREAADHIDRRLATMRARQSAAAATRAAACRAEWDRAYGVVPTVWYCTSCESRLWYDPVSLPRPPRPQCECGHRCCSAARGPEAHPHHIQIRSANASERAQYGLTQQPLFGGDDD